MSFNLESYLNYIRTIQPETRSMTSVHRRGDPNGIVLNTSQTIGGINFSNGFDSATGTHRPNIQNILNSMPNLNNNSNNSSPNYSTVAPPAPATEATSELFKMKIDYLLN